MRDRIGSGLLSWAFIGTCLLGGAACNAPPPTPIPDEQDAGTDIPDAGTDPEQTSSCSVPIPTGCPQPAPHYADVAPIFSSRCTSCHSGASGGPWPLTDYGHVADWQDTISVELRGCSMPPPDAGVPMTTGERVAILTWLRCGLPR